MSAKKGFAPLIILIAIAIAAIGSFAIYKAKQTPITAPPQQVAVSATPTVTTNPTPTTQTTKKNKPSPTPTPSQIPTSAPNSSSNNSNPSPTPTKAQVTGNVIQITTNPTPTPSTPYPTLNWKITSPAGGEGWQIGTQKTITWEVNDNVRTSLFYIGLHPCPSCLYYVISLYDTNARSYTWTVGVGNTGDGPYSQEYQVEIIRYVNGNYSDGGSSPTQLSSAFTIYK